MGPAWRTRARAQAAMQQVIVPCDDVRGWARCVRARAERFSFAAERCNCRRWVASFCCTVVPMRGLLLWVYINWINKNGDKVDVIGTNEWSGCCAINLLRGGC